MATNRGGRPKKPIAEKRSIAIKFSCTPAEIEFIEDHTKTAGFKQTALFLHEFFIKTIENGKFAYVIQNPINREYVVQLAAIGNSINQLTHLLHAIDINSHPIWMALNEKLDLMAQVIMLAAARAQEGKEEPVGFENKNEGLI